MDPLSVFSLAGNILQFIEFATKLLSSSVEIYKSSTGALDTKVALEEIYQRLSNLSRGFFATPESTASEPALRSIAESCSADCSRLLTVLNGIKVGEDDHRAWKSFRAALKIAWKGEQEIERLTSRLRDHQSAMTLQICVISNKWLQNMNQHLQNLKGQDAALQLQYSERLEKISANLQAIKLQISEPRTSRPGFMFSYIDLDELTNKLSQLSLTERNIARDQAILSSLDYSTRGERRENISKAHVRTFSWIFEASDQEITRQNGFLRWLRESDGVFWITGKPGSGKSTLMKFLAGHTKTMEALEQWATPERVVVASHFFWSLGISKQKSMEGLFQSLLYEIFRRCPELIREVCPSRWENDSSHLHTQDWTFKELVNCFRAIKENGNSTTKFCFFIDGLDEFDGDYIDICRTLSEIAECSRIKLCVASRPLNEFQDQFGADQSSTLYVHELTRNDIMDYARARLEEHPRWPALGLGGQEYQLFLSNIANLASGVFLWVTLAVQSLRRGLTNFDTMDELNTRLDALPKGLEAFYKDMLDSVEPIYRRKSANLLQIQLISTGMSLELPWTVTLLHEREYSDPEYAITMPWTTLSKNDVRALRHRASRRLIAKCCCIVEIRQNTLEFIHRTASDYLKTPEMVNYIQSRNGEGFNAHLSILKAWVACLKMGTLNLVEQDEPTPADVLYFVNSGVYKKLFTLVGAAINNGAREDEVFKHIDCLEDMSTLKTYPEEELSLNQWSTPVGLLYNPSRSSSFKECLIQMGALDYAAMKLSNNAEYFQGISRSALWSAIALSRFSAGKKFLHLLLRNGHDPNEIVYDWDTCQRVSIGPIKIWEKTFGTPRSYFGYSKFQRQPPASIWSAYLTKCKICGDFGPRRQVENELHSYSQGIFQLAGHQVFDVGLDNTVFSLLLHHGADPNAHPTPLTTAWVGFVCSGIRNPSRVTASDSYLKTLDDFFKYGADLGVSTVGLTLFPGDKSSHLPLRMTTGWDTFCEALEDLTGSETEEELNLISQITMKMIQQATSTRWPMGRLPSIIRRAFPKTLGQPILDMIF
ncbi:uncharacterized protein GGS22DRAFT_3110 [Annulohypoxylon maeteangense]|uniref:uncharacterized protein n=1 Tax=Annulohypoxylon maeteangense TaxID=1927788 RepID=UPI0020080C8B|nr:uncharacterized protein GGS22DRAFT_3110 [Annulohypoxylon maeteangense]KAI0889714.1 hypothetical protein GGS22DRAFT_3110 [Annulohypoxylon maeteangense]